MATDLESQTKTYEESIFKWDDLGYTLRDGKVILSGISASIGAGQMLAIMGPSGAGKSTLLDVLSQRSKATSGTISLDGNTDLDMSELSSYCEQDDALLGVLSVEETIRYAARLSLPPNSTKALIEERVRSTIVGLGLAEVASQRIGNAVQRGVSGGQRRRVTIGSSLVTLPRVLFLDEYTSSLDSTTSREVTIAIKNMAKKHNIIVVATIHQPNWETFSLFDKLLLLASGRTIYCGPVSDVADYCDTLGYPCPVHSNPADHAINLVNTDFVGDAAVAQGRIEEFAKAWKNHHERIQSSSASKDEKGGPEVVEQHPKNSTSFGASLALAVHQTGILIERNMLNYSRNLLAYGVRLGMYIGMGVLLATVWVNLAQTSVKVNDRLSVHFFSVAFLGFMSVAGIPAFLEERQVFVRERLNGLYGPGSYILANSICTAPFLFLCSAVFAVLCYWSIGLNPGATHFFKFLAMLFLAVYTAESQSVLVAAIIPIFVAALAIASFLNGFWMCVQGYFIKAVNLPRFWYYWAHWIDYQTYAFNVLVNNDFRGLTFECAKLANGACHCDYPSSLVSSGQCALAGQDVLDALDIGGINLGLYAGILVAITVVYRVLIYVVLVFKKR